MYKKIIMLGMVLGSTLGGYIPTLFGLSAFSFTAIICGAIGGVVGIWLTFRLLE